jgi:hypothetical protein
MTTGRRPGAGLLRLYPRAWRVRYEVEVAAMLELIDVTWRERLDLARGAMDAQLHASRVPAAAAFVAGGLWTIIGAAVVGQPVSPDWPGHLLETLPLAIGAVAAGAVAAIGCWARRSDRLGRRGVLVVSVAVLAHVLWAAALVGALVGVDYGASTAFAQDIGALGVLLLGLVVLRSGDERIGALLVIAPTVLLFGWPVAWLAYGLAWTIVAMLLLAVDDEFGGLPT